MGGDVFEDLVGLIDVPWDGWSTHGTVVGLSAGRTGDWTLVELGFADKRGAR
jgi:hypothetical protein